MVHSIKGEVLFKIQIRTVTCDNIISIVDECEPRVDKFLDQQMRSKGIPYKFKRQ